MVNGLFVVLKHTEEHKKCTDHHACTSLTGLTMDHDNWLHLGGIPAVHSSPRHLMVLLHSLQEETGVKAELEHLLQVRHVVIREGEPTDAEVLDGLLGVMILLFSAEIINLDHVMMMEVQEPDDVLLAVSVQAFEALSRESHRDNSIRDVGHVQVETVLFQTCLVRRDNATDPVS